MEAPGLWPLPQSLLLEEMLRNREEMETDKARQGGERKEEMGPQGKGDKGEWEKDPESENKRASLRGKPKETNCAFQEEEMVFLEESRPWKSSPPGRWIRWIRWIGD